MSPFVTGSVGVRVPSSSANLGPGFDSLGLALSLHDEVSAEVINPGGGTGLVISVEGEGAGDVPRDESHLVYRAMLQGFAAMRVQAPALRLHCRNAIPHGRGLGSSSAAIVAGLCVARALVSDGRSRLSDDVLFGLAAGIEGHPDNVAPAFYGGFTVAYREAGEFRAARLLVTSPLAFVVFVPAEPLATTVARGLLPSTVSHADAARNAGRAALLVAALTGQPDHLLAATEDRLHQAYRAPAMPASATLVAGLREAGFAAVVSGAGPSVLAMAVPEDVSRVRRWAPDGWRVLELEVDPGGARQMKVLG